MSVATLKIIAFICMLIDHIGFFFPTMKNYILLREIGRLAAPIFFFCFVEGYNHTHDKVRYRNRLFLCGVFMMFLNILMIYVFHMLNQPLSTVINPFIPDMYFTFFIMFQILYGIDCRNYKNFLWLVFIPFMEYSYIAFTSILILNYIRNKNLKFSLFTIVNTIICIFMHDYIELCMIGSICFLYFYNGKNGRNSKIYYLLYPLHFYFLAFLHFFIVST